jgi:hypothetical protein
VVNSRSTSGNRSPDARPVASAPLEVANVSGTTGKHRGCGLGTESVEVTAEIDQDDAIVTVRDSGQWCNRTSDGHGLRLIGTMTKTHTISSNDDGTTVTMVFDSKKVEV